MATTTDTRLEERTSAAVGVPTVGRAATSGLLAVATAFGASELVAGLSLRLRSPIVAVGDVVVDTVPEPVKRFAIATFGANDKIALIVGTVIVAMLLGGLLGTLARRRPAAGALAIGAFGALGVAASLRGPLGDLVAAVPSVVAGIVGAGVLVALLQRARAAASSADAPAAMPSRSPGSPGGPPRPRMRAGAGDRRAFLRLSGGVALGAVAMAAAGRALDSRLSAEPARAAITVPRPTQPLPALPAGVDLGVDGVAPFITPFDDFYRVDTALVIPQVDPEAWALRVTGMVDRPLTFSYADLLDRPLADYDITLTCVSNTVGGGLVGNARWQGVLVRDLLAEAGVSPAADQIVGRSVDGYTCGYPVAAALDRDAIVAVGMNGEPLPVERGFPARLVTPGLYGYVSATKWLAEIELTRFDAFDQYWVPRGWDEQAPIKTMARIDTPRSFEPVGPGPLAIAGVAWAQTRGIERVEVRVDDGDWAEAELAEVPGPDTWRQWRFGWDATPGSHRITVRATDGTGAVQTDERADPFPNGASGWQTLFLTVSEP
jgi:DMSO/TMAO reductase YedYZ molybdopterin-dependent catalytic subunit